MEAPEKILPPSIACDDIYVTLGSPWIPPDIIERTLNLRQIKVTDEINKKELSTIPKPFSHSGSRKTS